MLGNLSQRDREGQPKEDVKELAVSTSFSFVLTCQSYERNFCGLYIAMFFSSSDPIFEV